MRNQILAAAALLSLGACATVNAPVMTDADREAATRINPTTRELLRLCYEARIEYNCPAAHTAMINDPAVTQNMLELVGASERQMKNKAAWRAIGNFAYDVMAGPERSFRSCYRGDCVTTTYRVSQSGRISDVNSH